MQKEIEKYKKLKTFFVRKSFRTFITTVMPNNLLPLWQKSKK